MIKDDFKITIFTPTYNRAYCLNDLYQSLLSQNYKNFEWVIVDDGSTDNTMELITSWINENKLEIKYFYQKNSGKQMAYNKGVKEASGELFICIDSDDKYVNDAFQFIWESWRELKNNNEYAGMGFLSCDPDGNIIGKKFPEDIIDTTQVDLYSKYKVTGDKGLVFKTSILRKFPFPKIGNETFVTEALVYNRISKEYIIRYINKIAEIKKYREDGLSHNISNVMLKNPQGMILFYNEYLTSTATFKDKVKAAVEYIQWSLYYGKNITSIIKDSYNKVFVLSALALGIKRYNKNFTQKYNNK